MTMKNIIGRKLGMTSIFTESGQYVPVTVIASGPCTVVERKRADKDGYDAVVLGFEDAKLKKLTKAMRGRFEKLNTAPKTVLREFRRAIGETAAGDVVSVDSFEPGERVDVTGLTKGKGFAGVMKRWRASGGPASHGSMIHRQPASNSDTNSARVLKGSHRPGHLGVERVTTLNLEVVRADKERNLLLIKGAIPGADDSVVLVRSSVKTKVKS
jgi:large subunit ribosomal protein L3